jgi:hypothetical protein
MTSRIVYACDIGSTKHPSSTPPKFAWVRGDPEATTNAVGSHSIDALVRRAVVDISSGVSVALGFEAPLFIPVPLQSNQLSSARQGEGNRSFAAPAGSSVALLALHQCAWILAELAQATRRPCSLTLNIEDWPPPRDQLLFCWEAFVSGPAHGDTDLADAATAAAEFCANEESLAQANAVAADRPLSLIGAAAMWSGWVGDAAILHQPTLVIKPASPRHLRVGDAQQLADADPAGGRKVMEASLPSCATIDGRMPEPPGSIARGRWAAARIRRPKWPYFVTKGHQR